MVGGTVRKPSPAPTSPAPATEPSRAGSRAGEGRQRPGRPDVPETEEGAVVTDADPEHPEAPGRDGGDVPGRPDLSAPAEKAQPAPSPPLVRPGAGTVAHAGRSAEPALRILPLGSGLVLIGLGLGLGLFALRLRRSQRAQAG
ncbi:hypothetical protein [Streptomyces sp. enrichment culture]|uniref:hypothetical protein n=1 Tax=Streptomyces sp. enrichment culture TaxID=1795815 RepID=UPI003F56B6D5